MSMISIKKALIYGTNELKKSNIDSARLDAEILLGFVLGFVQEKLFLNPRLPITNYQLLKFKKLIAKRAKRVPIAYLTGSKEFYGIDFYVNKDVLVPRPETETLIEEVLEFCRGELHSPKNTGRIRYAPTILEIGTGSGCIALTLAKYLPKAKIIATDISERALAVARKNQKLLITNYQLRNKARFSHSNLLLNIKTKPDILIANLPYLTKKELKEPSITKEPYLALYGGKDGLEIYEQLLLQIKQKFNIQYLISNISVFIEINPSQKNKIIKIIKNIFPHAKVEIKKDLAGKDRVVIIKI